MTTPSKHPVAANLDQAVVPEHAEQAHELSKDELADAAGGIQVGGRVQPQHFEPI